MSVIAVKNINLKCSLPQVVKSLARTIRGEFEALNFHIDNRGEKVCYLQLSQKLDPNQIVERINRITKYASFIPKVIPNLPPSSKRGKIPFKLRRTLKLPTETRPEAILIATHNEILAELQSKFAGLYSLSKKMDHKLMDFIARTVFERLRPIMEKNADASETGFKLSRCYRKLHPHFGDFQMILGSLHAVQDAAGVPRQQISEQELTTFPGKHVGGNSLKSKVLSNAGKYTDQIIAKVMEHLKELGEAEDDDTKQKTPRDQVRGAMAKISPYMPLIIRQVISQHFRPEQVPYRRMRIYGEPFLPPKEHMTPFTKKYNAVKVMRSDRMFNVLRFNVPSKHYDTLLAKDGTEIGGAKLVIRSSSVPMYKAKDALIAEMKAVFGVEHKPGDECMNEDWDDVEAIAD